MESKKAYVRSIICRLFHHPVPYPMAAWSYRHYSHYGRCGEHRWSWWDRISGWLRGYKFGYHPNRGVGIERH